MFIIYEYSTPTFTNRAMPGMSLPLPEIPKTPNKPPKHLLTWEEAEDRLSPYSTILAACIQHGWDMWKDFYAPQHLILDARARAAIVFCHIVDCAEKKFTGLDGVKFTRRNNSFMLYIGDDIVLRFKKLRKNGRCSSIATRQQMLFKAQMELPGMESGTLLHAGYSLDIIQHDILQKLVVCQFKNRVLWTIELPTADGGTIEVMPAPSMPEPPTKDRWTAKDTGKKDRKPKVIAMSAGKE
jgi:hypothetical protein